MSLFFALLSLLVVGGIVAVGVEALTSQSLGVIRILRPLAVELAAAVATTSMLGSLYMSEIANYTPCRLCWVQRFFMYPAAVLLIVAVFVPRAWLRWAAFGLAAVGLPISAYHRWDQANPDQGAFCDPLNPCSVRWVNEFGFITIPTMAGIGFAGVMVLLLLTSRKAA